MPCLPIPTYMLSQGFRHVTVRDIMLLIHEFPGKAHTISELYYEVVLVVIGSLIKVWL